MRKNCDEQEIHSTLFCVTENGFVELGSQIVHVYYYSSKICVCKKLELNYTSKQREKE